MKRKSYVIPQNQISFLEPETPDMPVFDKSRCEVRLINYETAARMVESYHYAHRVPSIILAMGMFVDGVLVGVCTYGSPPNNNLCVAFGEENRGNVLELNRLFIFDGVGRNSESWLVGQSFKFLPTPRILISYADTKEKHVGYIYQATNWLYTGLSESGGYQSDMIINGQVVSPKQVYNLYGTKQMTSLIEMGLRVEKTDWYPKHRYVYFLGSKMKRKELKAKLRWPILPYPK